MPSPRWNKLLRDIWLTRGRMALMVAAIAVSLFGVGTVLNAYSILVPEIRRNYLQTNPAAATIELDAVDQTLLDAVRQQPGIAAAEARETITARVEIAPDQWRPMLLFVVPDFAAMQIATFQRESGAWPPPTGSILLERTALAMADTEPGRSITVKTPNGTPTVLLVSGVVYDPSLAPAWQEREGYGYITPATLVQLGESGTLSELKITVAGSPFHQATIERTTRALGAWLQQQGHTVEELQIPPAGQHPHQGQMNAVMALLSFAGFALLLSAILVATMIAGLLAQQTRQIGAMKTIGARTSQITAMYVVMILLTSGLALALAVPPGVLVGRAFARAVADLLNFTIANDAIPLWAFAVEAAAGLLVPLLVAAVPILHASRITVYQALSDYGVSQPGTGLRAIRGSNATLVLALRNIFRRRARLLLTLALLASGGAMFITGITVRDGWQALVADGLLARRYNLEVRFSQPVPGAALLNQLATLPGVARAEAWGYSPTTAARPGQLDVVRTYPDGGHGAFAIYGPPPDTALVAFPLLAGRWLQPGDTDAVVLNQMALRQLPGVGVGSTVELRIGEQASRWQVVGIVQEVGLGAAAYTSNEAFAQAAQLAGQTRSVRLVLEGDATARAATIRNIERALAERGVQTAISDTDLEAGLDGHIMLLIVALVFTALLMAVVGVLGLMSALGTSVAERTREFGIMQTLGGTPFTLGLMVVLEGLTIGAMSWLLAVALAVPLSLGVNGMVGRMMFNLPLPLLLAPQTALGWLVLVGAVVASAFPAWRAAQLTIRETLAAL